MPKAANLAFALLLAAAHPVIAQTLYKWIDADGKTQYSDKPPKGFKGDVTRLETETDGTTLPPSPPAAPNVEKAKVVAPASDIAAKRRATRVLLEARLTKARANVEAARKALAQSETPEGDERQVIQQRGPRDVSQRANCRSEGTGRQKVLVCPTFVPNEAHRDRVAGLEENVRKAEEDLAEAERAWRRGVD